MRAPTRIRAGAVACAGMTPSIGATKSATANRMPVTMAVTPVSLLLEQVTAPVRWLECAQELVRLGATHVVEVGPGKVLSGLMKRIDKSVVSLQVDDAASLDKTVAALQEVC